GWRPARTIVLAAWDGEEWGLLGSTEWAEAHGDELRAKAVAYYNSDTNEKGWIGVAGSHALERFFTELARDVTQPGAPGGGSVIDAWRDHQRRERARDTTADTAFTIGALGSGSDYTAFLDHLGLPTANLAYGGASQSGIYHSIYDTWTFYERFLDSSYTYEALQAQTTATALLRTADAPVLPFEFGAAARTWRRYVEEIAKLAAKNDTTKGLDLAAVRAAVSRVDTAALAYEAALAKLDGLSAAQVAARRVALAALRHPRLGDPGVGELRGDDPPGAVLLLPDHDPLTGADLSVLARGQAERECEADDREVLAREHDHRIARHQVHQSHGRQEGALVVGFPLPTAGALPVGPGEGQVVVVAVEGLE